MRDKISKKGLAIKLSKLAGFDDPKVSNEQYMTPSGVSSAILWESFVLGDIDGKVIVDLGCGTGVLGLGALYLGGSKCYFLESENSAIAIAKQNAAKMQSESKAVFLHQDVSKFETSVDTVIMNPPFGVQSEHSDKKFLEVACKVGQVVYSLHKTSTKKFVSDLVSSLNFEIERSWDFLYPLKASYSFHSKPSKDIEVTCFRLVRKN